MRIKIKITEEFINSGRPKDPFSCPIALYLKDEDYQYVRVTCEDVNFCHVTNNDTYTYYQAPVTKRMVKFIKNFDTFYTEKVKPQNFIIDARVISIREWNEKESK